MLSFGFAQNAYAAVPTVVSAEVSGGNTVTIVFSEPVIALVTDFSDLQLTTAGPRGLDLITGSLTDTITITFLGGAVDVDETGTIDVGGALRAVSDLSPIVPINDLALLDGQLGSGSVVAETVRDISSRFDNMVPATISLSSSQIFSKAPTLSSSGKISSFTSNVDTNKIRVGESTNLALEFPDYAVDYLSEIRLYLNLQDSKYQIADSDTFVVYNKYEPLRIEDPHGYFDNVDVKIQEVSGNVKYDFDLTFAKEMNESDLIIQYIDKVRNARSFEFGDALQIVSADYVEPTKEVVSDSKQVELSRFEQIMKYNTDNGIDTSRLTDETLTQDWITAIRADEAIEKSDAVTPNTIPSGIKKEFHQWATGQIPAKEFEKTIQYLIANNYLEASESEFLAFAADAPDWMKEQNNWWNMPIVSDAQLIDTVKSLIEETIEEIPEVITTQTLSDLGAVVSDLKLLQNHDWDKWNVNGITLDPKVYLLLQSQNPAVTASTLGLLFDNGKTNLILETQGLDKASLKKLQNLGHVSIESDKHIQITIDYHDLAKLYSIDGITKIRAPYVPEQFSSQSEDLGIVSIDDEFVAQNSGKNIRVAVIDMAFDLENQKIISNVVDSKSFRFGTDNAAIDLNGLGSEKIHGTAVAELVVDTAPDSNLFLYTMGNDLEFVEALDEAMTNQVDVVVIPLGWPDLPTDGSSHITQVVSEFAESGIITILPAGNYGERHWEKTFTDSNENGWNEFDDLDEGLSFTITQERVQSNIPIKVNLLWENYNEVYDFDMVVLDDANNIVEFSANEQGTIHDKPFEQISFYPKVAGTYAIGVVYDGDKTPNTTLEIFSINDELEHVTTAGSVTVPTDAKGVIVTGAGNPESNTIESFSSQGPTNDGQSVPHVYAPGAGATIVTGDKPFQGTSASVPYLGGVVARMLEDNPSLSSYEIINQIKNSLE